MKAYNYVLFQLLVNGNNKYFFIKSTHIYFLIYSERKEAINHYSDGILINLE
jgi:hypothetical protein